MVFNRVTFSTTSCHVSQMLACFARHSFVYRGWSEDEMGSLIFRLHMLHKGKGLEMRLTI